MLKKVLLTSLLTMVTIMASSSAFESCVLFIQCSEEEGFFTEGNPTYYAPTNLRAPDVSVCSGQTVSGWRDYFTNNVVQPGDPITCGDAGMGSLGAGAVIALSASDIAGITTSKPYVDTRIETTQVKIPAAGAQGVGVGDSVITYTGTAGTIGERGLYTGGNYGGAGDKDKLITASALNNAFTNVPTTDTTKLQCANPGTCTLWTIVDQTAYGIDLFALSRMSPIATCSMSLSTGTIDSQIGGNCLQGYKYPSNYGDWWAGFNVSGDTVLVNGISACSALTSSGYGLASNQAAVQADYESNMVAAPTSSPAGVNCYCKVIGSTAGWVHIASYQDSGRCAQSCASNCGVNTTTPTIRSLMFIGAN